MLPKFEVHRRSRHPARSRVDGVLVDVVPQLACGKVSMELYLLFVSLVIANMDAFLFLRRHRIASFLLLIPLFYQLLLTVVHNERKLHAALKSLA